MKFRSSYAVLSLMTSKTICLVQNFFCDGYITFPRIVFDRWKRSYLEATSIQ